MARLISKKGEADRPEPLQDFAARTLTRAIVTGELKPGEKLSPTKLAEDLGISHIPVREALSALEAAGHVVRQPRVGFFVAELSLDYIEDVYHWRRVLEDEAHRLAIPRLSDSDLVKMRKLNAQASRTTGISNRYLDLNREFHFVAFERAGSATLLRFLNHLWDASLRYQNALATVPRPHSQLTDQHEALVEAFEARDVKLVNARMAEHRGGTLVAMRDLVSAHEQAANA
jgi:DNA-binding GntR family transcriptional regulator